MILGCALLPFVRVSAVLELGRDAVGVSVCHEASVLVLCLDVSVEELHKEKLLKVHSLVEDLLCVVK